MNALGDEKALLNRILEVLTEEEKEELLKRLKDDTIIYNALLGKFSDLKERKSEQETENQEFYSVSEKYMKQRHLSIVQLSTEIGISRNTWRNRREHNIMPSKKQVLQMCILLQLDINEANYLMCLAGYIFSSYSETDKIIYKCLAEKVYNLAEVDRRLLEYGQNMLFSE